METPVEVFNLPYGKLQRVKITDIKEGDLVAFDPELVYPFYVEDSFSHITGLTVIQGVTRQPGEDGDPETMLLKGKTVIGYEDSCFKGYLQRSVFRFVPSPLDTKSLVHEFTILREQMTELILVADSLANPNSPNGKSWLSFKRKERFADDKLRFLSYLSLGMNSPTMSTIVS